MTGRLDAFLKPLDWRMRLGLWAAFCVLGLACATYGLRLASLGPWLGALGCGVAASTCVWVVERSWPSKLPAAGALLVDKWKTVRGKAAKSGQGKFAWNLGRTVLGAFLASKAIGFLPGASSEVRIVSMIGFGVSFGFFGLESAIWGLLTAGTVAHVAASYGLGLDVSDPVARRYFVEAWDSGAMKLSWFWAFGFVAVAPIWIGISAAVGKTKKSIGRAARKRREEALAKTRIDARRARMSGMPGVKGDSALDKAREKLEEAKARVKLFDRSAAGQSGTEGADTSLHNVVSKELTGVEKLENEKMVSDLKSYAAQVASIRQVEKQGLDVDTPARRSFDRVILSLSDEYLKAISADKDPSVVALYDYYLSMCEGESAVLRGGDGELVTSVSVVVDPDDEDEIDGIGAGWDMRSAPVGEIGVLGDVMDEDEDEDEVAVETPVSSARPVDSDRASVDAVVVQPAEPAMMLAPTIGDDDVPMEPLPLESDVDEDMTEQMHEEHVTQPEVVVSDRDEDSDHGKDVGSDVSVMPAAVVDGRVVDGEASFDDDPAASEADDEGGDSEPGDGIDEQPYDEGGHLDEPPVDPEASSQDGPSDAPVGDVVASDAATDASVPAGDASVATPSPSVSQPSAAEMNVSAMKIIMRKTGRDFVASTSGLFLSTADLAKAVGFEDDDFAEPFDEYRAKVDAYLSEQALRVLVDAPDAEPGEDGIPSDAAADVIEHATTSLVAMGWEHDAALVDRATTRVGAIREATRLAREQRDLAEQKRLEAIEAERIRAEEADFQASEAIRIAAEEAATRQAAEAQKVADEEARLLALEQAAARSKELLARRGKIAIHIVMGRLTEATIVDAMELFEDAQSLAEALDVDLEEAQTHFDRYAKVRDARQKYRELLDAFMAEDVTLVEALLRDEGSFEGHVATDISIDDVRTWAEGVRVRERVSGLVDGTKPVADTGGSAGRRFMMKRTLVSVELAEIVDELIPGQLRVAASLRSALAGMGANAPEALHASLRDTEAKAADYARTLVTQGDPKVKIGEYVSAFLPVDVRVEGEDAWDMLVRMAASVPERPPEPEPAPAAVPPEPPVQVPAAVDPAPATDASAQPAAPPDRIKTNTPVGMKKARTLQEVQALDVGKEVARIPKAKFDQDQFFRKQILSLRGHLGERTSELTNIDGNMLYVSILDPLGERMGRVRIQSASLTFVWFQEPDRLWMKDMENGDVKYVSSDKLKRASEIYMLKPDGDPETVIGSVMMSGLVTPDGLTSAKPLLDMMGERYAILSWDDSIGLTAFLDRISKL